eukprot:14927-Heterococcus_DN1.PRE.2
MVTLCCLYRHCLHVASSQCCSLDYSTGHQAITSEVCCDAHATVLLQHSLQLQYSRHSTADYTYLRTIIASPTLCTLPALRPGAIFRHSKVTVTAATTCERDSSTVSVSAFIGVTTAVQQLKFAASYLCQQHCS